MAAIPTQRGLDQLKEYRAKTVPVWVKAKSNRKSRCGNDRDVKARFPANAGGLDSSHGLGMR